MIAGLAGISFQRDAFRFPRLLIWFGAFILWCAIGYVRTLYPAPTWDRLVDLVKLWAVVLVAVNALRSRAHIRFFSVFLLGCFALALFAICCIVGQWSQLRRVLDPARRLRLVLTLLAVTAAVAFFAPNGVWVRVAGLKHLTTTERLDKVDQEGSARQRFEIWRVASKIIHEHPLTGIGAG